MKEYLSSAEEVLQEQNSSPEGLSSQEAATNGWSSMAPTS